MNTADKGHLVLVPCDFSPLAYQAIEHGAYMSMSMSSRLVLLHVSAREADIPAMEKKMSFVAEECFDRFDIRPETMVRQGSQPYSVIKAVAKELNPSLVVLKTGGGVHTIKILSGTSTPFLVIQGPPNDVALKNIAFPINFLNRHDEKLRRVILFSEYYPDAVMSVITPSGKGTAKERNISGSLALMGKVMESQGIKTNFVTHDKEKNTAELILELSRGADMIVIQMEAASLFRKFLFGLREEKLITNADKIPVLCFNREADFKVVK
ncbi:MAG: universal stress protein [Bacteroidales bacterium]|jgi:nucleotide-binding universal stress UspA family protein|nr:universal stress protein [Bacteroidales bacterium]